VPDLIKVRRLRELHVDQGSTTELNAQRNAMPEENGRKSGDAEDQREGKEIPFLAKEIDVGITK
jgi:hypothetical protein